MKMEDKMTTANNLNSIAVNVIFDQLLETDPTQKVPGEHEQILLKRCYKMFG